MVKKCDIQWTIQVKDGNTDDNGPMLYARVDVVVDAAQPQQVETDEHGYITLVFTKGTDLGRVTVFVEDTEDQWSGTAGAAQEASGNEYSSEVLLTGTWSLSVQVHDMRPRGVAGAPIALKKIPLVLLGPKPGDAQAGETTDDGEAWTKDGLRCEMGYMISVSDGLGAIVENSTVSVRVNGNPVPNVGGNQAQTEANVTVRRTNNNALTIEAMPNGAQVDVDFQLKFPTVFIVGEGPSFPYAIQLAIRFGKGQWPRNLTRTAEGAPATSLAQQRKWIIASQYDVHAPPAHPPDNLFVYRDAGRNDVGNVGRFDVRDRQGWTRLAGAAGQFDLFDAMVFNNPHPGFGMHYSEVKGVRRNGLERQYISVHSIGWNNTLNGAALQTFKDLADNATAQVQKQFLNDRGCNQDGNDDIHDWLDDGTTPNITIPNAFAAIDQAAVAFNQRVTHYTFRRQTTGVWFSILRCYCRNGTAALKAGGEMYVNGSQTFQSAVDNGHLRNFENGVTWSTGQYYANYRTNFTSDTFHPSWFEQGWNPGEPNLANALYYRWVKP